MLKARYIVYYYRGWSSVHSNTEKWSTAGNKDPMETLATPQEDGKKNYANMVLEFGMLFKCWLKLIKMPDRNRGIHFLKMTKAIFKAVRILSKYSYEIVC